MKKTLTLLFSFFLVISAFGQSNYGKIQGKIVSKKTKSPIGFATVIVKKDGVNKGGTYSDANGNYSVPALEPGTYTVMVKFVDYNDAVYTDIEVNANSIKFLNIEMSQPDAGKAIGVIRVVATRPLIEKDKNQTTLSSGDITKLPTRSLNAIAATSSAVTQTSSGLSFLGRRTDGNAYYVDGVRVIGSTGVPQAAQGQIDIIQSGIPAQYGDFTGGAINITTKGPSRSVRRSFEAISSSQWDAYKFNQVEMSAVGPLWIKNKGGGAEEYVKLGYLVAGNINYTVDPSPGYGGWFVASDEALAEIIENPLAPNPNGTGLVPRASLLTSEDLVHESARRNVARLTGNFQGKLEFQPNRNSTLTFYGSYSYANGSNFQFSQSLMNYDENSISTSQTLRTYVKFTQRLQSQNVDDKENETPSKFGDAYYTIRLDYQNNFGETQNPTHRDNFFNYGYLGKFTSYRQPIYSYNADAQMFVDQNGDTVIRQGYFELDDYGNSRLDYEASDLNPARANYTKNLYETVEAQGGTIFSEFQVLQGLGLLNGFNANATYSLWSNPGTVAYFYSKAQNERIAAYAQGNATLKLKNQHDLQFGMYFEQNFSSRWAISANNLWRLMPLLANSHISNLDKVTENGVIVTGEHAYDQNGLFLDTVNYNIRVDYDQQTTFDRNLRAKLMEEGRKDVYGNAITETSWIDVNSLSPDDFSIDMFSADDLWNNGNTYIAYYGYDYLGNRDRKRYGLNDFVNNADNRHLGAFAPVYNAIWFEDKFQFKDLILRLGVRVERYDANQNVLKDQYSLYPTYSVAEVKQIETDGIDGSVIPNNMGDDYVVYVDDIENPTEILGYRDGAVWYDETGGELSNPDIIAQNSNGNRIQPYLVNSDEEIIPESFEDYDPQINVLPRVWFSFPINVEAQFFANYDVLAQRPTQGLVFVPYNQYAFLEFNQGGGLANAALKPRVTTNYELGFKQTLSRNSALSIIASYSESRGEWALVRVNQAYPVSYNSYSNIDFSTTKSFRAEYELRGKGRTSLALNYALLFSDGTGSNTNSSAALIAANLPNLRSLYPTQRDVRHKIVARIDYRFKGGDDYTGPIWFGKKFFANSGANLIVTTKSGEPYTAYANPVPSAAFGVPNRQTLEGNPFGSRKPWQTKIDANINKNFMIKKRSVKDERFRMPVYQVQVFLWVQNILNARIVNSVYGFTGLPNDDGWLSSPEGQQQVANELNSQSYVDLYNAKVDFAYRYGAPRMARLGVKFIF